MNVSLRRFSVGWLLLGAIVLTSCHQQALLSRRPTTLKADDAAVTLTLSGWQSNPNETRLLHQVLQTFEAKNPDIHVKYEVINSEYMDVIKTRLIGDVAPDVFYLDALEAPALMQYNVLEPLDAYITPAFNLADFEPSLLKVFKYNGELYGLPKDFATLALLYNQKAFAAANLSHPPQTWDELVADSKKLTIDRNHDGKVDQYGFGLAPELARQAFVIKAFNGALIDQNGYATFAASASLKGLQLVIDQYRRDRTSVQPTDVGATSGSEMFGQGRVAMTLEGTWALSYLQETFPELDVATAEVPTINGNPGTMAFTVAYVMNRKTKHKAAAWKLIAYLTGTEGMSAWAKQGLALPTRRSVLASLGYDKKPLYAPFVKSARYATIWQAGENLPTIRMNFNNQFISALLGEQSLKQAMEKAQATANRDIYLAK